MKESGDAIDAKAIALLPVVVVVLCGQGSPVNHLVILNKEVVSRVNNDTPKSNSEDENSYANISKGNLYSHLERVSKKGLLASSTR